MAPRAKNENETEESPLLRKNEMSSTETVQTTLWHRMRDEIRVQFDTAFPTLQSMVLTKIPWLISLRFVGGIGAEELAAAALATTLCNVTGLSLSVGLSSALTTLAGQAKGELLSRANHERQRRVGFDMVASGNDGEIEVTIPKGTSKNDKDPITTLVYFYRGMFIQLALVIPVGIWWIFGIKDVLIYLGQPNNIAAMTEVSNQQKT